jgi:serine/threonine protein phosphatase PrpC
LVTLLTSDRIYIANAGDCRAVLNNNHFITALTVDHKPDLESARIERAGYWVRGGRINDVLSVSRGIGDYGFKLNRMLRAES